MKRLAHCVAGGLLGLMVASAAHGAPIDTLVLTSSGATTVFTVAGTFTPETPETDFSAPNTAYVLTFTVESTPSEFAFVDPSGAVFGIDTTAVLNGVAFPGSQAIFFSEAGPGGAGLVLCVGSACQPDPETLPYPSATFWDIYTGTPVFSGIAPDVTFIAGEVAVNSPPSFHVITAPVPEPASITLAAVGLVLALRRRRDRGAR